MIITYQPASGPAVSVSVVFSDPSMVVQGNADSGVETLAPTVFGRLEDLPVDPEFDDPILTIGGVAYRVTERRPAGLGAFWLAVRKLP